MNPARWGRLASGLFVRRPRPLQAAALAAAAFLALTVAVTTSAVQAWDRAAIDWFRPSDEWGPTQIRLVPIIDGLEPRRAYPFLVLVTLAACIHRRSWRPGAFTAVVAGCSMALTLVTKLLTHRPDPHQDIATTGGSFPSGHVLALVACLGCCALIWSSSTRWWHWVLVAVPSTMMSAALLYTAAHWVTDVLGGAVLGVGILCGAVCLRLRSTMMRVRPVGGGTRDVRDVEGRTRTARQVKR